jgi:exodeoxyribonuclease VII large subunit
VQTSTTGIAVMSVADAVATADRAVVAAAPDQVWVHGEVSGLYRSPAGHLYCTLHGDGARLSVCALGRDARAIDAQLDTVGVSLADGQQVRLRGRLGCYPARGSVELRVTAIDPSIMLGCSELARRQLRQALKAEGAIERQGCLELSLVPERVWLVGPEGDGVEDFISVLASSPWSWDVIFVPTNSEGPSAPEAIAAAIKAAPRETQAIVLARGGGERATIAYDSEGVARAICGATIPVITAIGHSADRSVADECAWRSVATPTAAAELLCRRMGDTAEAIETRLIAIGAGAEAALARCRAEIERRSRAVRYAADRASARIQAAHADAALRRARRLAVALALLAFVLTAFVLIGALR